MHITLDTDDIVHDVLLFVLIYSLYLGIRFIVYSVGVRTNDLLAWLKQRKVSTQFKRKNSQTRQPLNLNTNLSQSFHDDASKSGRMNLNPITEGTKPISPVSSLDAFTVMGNEKKIIGEGTTISGLESPGKCIVNFFVSRYSNEKTSSLHSFTSI